MEVNLIIVMNESKMITIISIVFIIGVFFCVSSIQNSEQGTETPEEYLQYLQKEYSLAREIGTSEERLEDLEIAIEFAKQGQIIPVN